MKIFIVLMVIVMSSAKIPDYVPTFYHELIESLRQTCMPKVGISEDMVDDYVISDNSEKMKCYMNCMMREAKWMAPDGTIAYDMIIAQIHPDIEHIAYPMLEKCRVIESGPHECDTAYNFNVCLQKGDPKHYFLP